MIRRLFLSTGLVFGIVACERPPTADPGGRAQSGAARRGTFDGISVVEVVIVPHGPPATQYGGTLEQPLSPSEQAIANALEDLPMSHSGALSRMARELARTSPDRVNIPPALVDGLMAWAGITDPPPRLVVVELPEDDARCDAQPGPSCRSSIESLVRQVQSTLPEASELSYGVGVARVGRDATRMIVAVVERAVVLEPVATAVGLGRPVVVRGRLVGSRTRPSVEVVDPNGAWQRVPTVVGSDGTFAAEVQCGRHRGPHQVEVLVEGDHGPEVAANFPVYCGMRVPDRMTVEIERLASDVTAEQIAHANFSYLNEERKRRGLPELQWDARAADIALAHSRDMARNNFVGHRSPRTGDVSNRFQRARLEGTVIRENVARGYGPKGIHDSLMRSPGHRVNLLAPDVTHVGIGVVIGEPETNVAGGPRPIFATQNFYRVPGAGAPTDPAALMPTMQRKVDASRRSAGLPGVQWDPVLSRSAAELAQTYARGRQPRPDWQQKAFAAGFAAVEAHQVQSADFDALGGIELWRQRDLNAGLGIVRVRTRGGGESFLMVVLVGERS